MVMTASEMSGYPQINLSKLKEPFSPTDIEWRVGQAGKKRDGGVWAQVLAYITSRAVQDRLDEVCGPANWKNEYQPGPHGGVICGISVRINGEWVTKWDGADNTDIESVKGGLSDSMKRAAVQWGIGRYLYDLGTNWAEIVEKGSHKGCVKAKKQGDSDVYFDWNPPQLPSWALPEHLKGNVEPAKTAEPRQQPANGSGKQPAKNTRQANGAQNSGSEAKAVNGTANGTTNGNSDDREKFWLGRLNIATAPKQLRAMKGGIDGDAGLTDEKKSQLKEVAERRAVEREKALENAGAPPG